MSLSLFLCKQPEINNTGSMCPWHYNEHPKAQPQLRMQNINLAWN